MGYLYGGNIMLDGIDICEIMNETHSCINCGDSEKWRPCKELIPHHIPDEQIKKWLIARRPNV